MTIPIHKYNPTYVGKSGSNYRSVTRATSVSTGSQSCITEDTGIADFNRIYEDSWGTVDAARTYVNNSKNIPSRSATPAFSEANNDLEKDISYAPSSYQNTTVHYSSATLPQPATEDEPLSKKIKIMLMSLRILHTISGIMLLVSIGGMQVYMFFGKISVLVIPLFVCRLFLMSCLVVLILCDWTLPKNVHKHFPMYNDRRSWKGLGISQLVIAFFVLGDSSLGVMEKNRDENVFARILFPLLLTFSSLMIFVGLAYFIAGAVGGVKLKNRFKR